jgi:diguanylate cyclase (GGDEF)-like protein/PAS domain S-box-containing protein
MPIDIHTLAIVLSLSNLLQVIALLVQYWLDKTYRGLGWWTLGTAAWSLGFVFAYLRDGSPLGLIAIVANNALFVAGLIFIHLGVLRFLGRRAWPGALLAFFGVFILIVVYFTYVQNDLMVRRVNISLALAILSFVIAWCLFVCKTESVKTVANLLASVFFANAVLLTLRALTPFFAGPVGDLFTASLIQTATYLDALVVSSIWTFGFIILVNQRLHAENREAKENLELIFNTSPNAFLIARLTDGLLVAVNDGFASVTGFSRAEIIGRSTLELGIWHDPLDRQKIVDELNEKGFCDNVECVFQRRDGERRIGAVSARLIKLQGVQHIVSVIRDITNRKRADAALRESQQQLRDIIDFLPDATLALDRERRVIIWNRAIEDMTGIPAAEMLGKGDYVYTIPFYGEPRRNLTDLVFLDEQEVADRYRQIRREGQSLTAEAFCNALYNHQGAWIFAKAAPLHDPSGNVIGVIESIRDITESKRAEDALRASQQFLSDIIDNNGAIIYVKDPAGRYELINRKWLDTTGLRRETVLGKTDADLFPGPTGEAFRQFDLQVMASGTVLDQEETLAAATGTRYFISTKFPLWGTDGAIKGVCGISTDITQRKRLEHELQQQAMTDELTGAFNRRHFLRVARDELKRALRLRHPLAIAVIDFDHFKQVNDTYGHAAGDQALLALTRICRENIREIDVFARFGGDEFILLLPETNDRDGYLVVERIRLALTAHPIDLAGHRVAITITAGVAGLASEDESLDTLLARADQALYQAKDAGRNRVGVILT